jgi:hypothetical protein
MVFRIHRKGYVILKEKLVEMSDGEATQDY